MWYRLLSISLWMKTVNKCVNEYSFRNVYDYFSHIYVTIFTALLHIVINIFIKFALLYWSYIDIQKSAYNKVILLYANNAPAAGICWHGFFIPVINQLPSQPVDVYAFGVVFPFFMQMENTELETWKHVCFFYPILNGLDLICLRFFSITLNDLFIIQ